jgi:chemotaxis protein methyltransferase CheR
MTPQGFVMLAEVLRDNSGLTIGPDKLYLLEARLAPILRAERLSSLDALAARLHAPGAARLIRAIVEAMTTNETSFFRDGAPFVHFRTQALPFLFAARPSSTPLRIWSAAASTGQEAYSLAMSALESGIPAGRAVEIIGTDLARGPLARARQGLYTQFEVQRGLPVQLLLKYFSKVGESWRVAESIRALVQFREWNLLDDLRPLGRFDVVFCRNVLLYFDPPTKARVLSAIARQMAPDGFLYLGSAETVLGICDCFVPVPGEHGVYGLAPATRSARILTQAASR